MEKQPDDIKRSTDALRLMSSRAERLARLIKLGAPDIIIESEVDLILQARDWWREANKHNWEHFKCVREEAAKRPLTRTDLEGLGLSEEQINAALGN